MQIQSLESKISSALAPRWAVKMVYPDLLKAESTNIHQRAENIGAFFFLKLSKWLHFGFFGGVVFLFLTQNTSLFDRVNFSLLPDING